MEQRSDREYRRDFYRAVDIQHGTDERAQAYYVPIYEREGMRDYDHVPRMRDEIDFSVAQSVQLFSGFRGCGKTSELVRLSHELRAEGYRVAFMDVEDYFNTLLPMETAILPHALAAGFAHAIDHDLNGPPMRRYWEFLRRIRFTGKGTLDVDGGMVKAGVEIAPYLKDDPTFAAEAKHVFNHNRRTFRAEFHAFFADILATLDATEPVVFIVDSIDHFRGIGETFEQVRSSVEATFIELAADLQIPNLHIIYTIPIYLEVGSGSLRHVVNVKLHDRAGAVYEPGYAALHDVIARRAPGADPSRLMSEECWRELITLSGGTFRDLLRLTRLILVDAKSLPVDASAVQRAAANLRDNYTTVLTREHLDILRQVRDTHMLFTDQARKGDEMQLITMGAILRYPNAQTTWFDVHPLLKPLL